MADSDLFMECEEEELEPWQQIHENVQTERMEPFERISTVKQVTGLPAVVTPAPVTARVPASVPVVSTHMVLSGQTLSGNSQDTRVSLLTNTQSLVTPLASVPVPITLPTGLPKPDQGQQLIFTQGAGGLSTVALSQVLLSAPGPCPSAPASQPIILTTQGLPVQNLMAGQNPLGIVLNVQQGQTIKPITLVSAPGTSIFKPAVGGTQIINQPAQLKTVPQVATVNRQAAPQTHTTTFTRVQIPATLTIRNTTPVSPVVTVSSSLPSTSVKTTTLPTNIVNTSSLLTVKPGEGSTERQKLVSQVNQPLLVLPSQRANGLSASSAPTTQLNVQVSSNAASSSALNICPRCGAHFKMIEALRGHMCFCCPDLTQAPTTSKVIPAQPLTTLTTIAPAVQKETGKLVMLVDDFYYGTYEGNRSNAAQDNLKTPMIFKCLSCGKKLRNNIKLMNHMKHHMELEQQNGEMDTHTSCQHCYRQFPTPFRLQCHLESVHSSYESNTKCKICEWAFETEPVFLQHMKNTHKPGEMPYVCQVCEYRSSFYSDVYSHFRTWHEDTRHLLCLYCLKVFKNSNTYQQHFSRHQKSTVYHCNKCRLQFLFTKEKLDHKMSHHKTFRRPRQLEGLLPGTKVTIRAHAKKKPRHGTSSAPPPGALVTQSKQEAEPVKITQPCTASKPMQIVQLSRSSVSKKPISKMIELLTKFQEQRPLFGKQKCIECNYEVPDFSHHYPTYVHCSLCPYSTCCSRAYANHMINNHVSNKTRKFKGPTLPPPSLLRLACADCDFTTFNGDVMARHFVQNPEHSYSTCTPKELLESDIEFSEVEEEEEEEERRREGTSDVGKEPDWASVDDAGTGEGQNTKPIPEFTDSSGPCHTLSKYSDAIDYFQLLFPNSLMELITYETNVYAKSQRFLGLGDSPWTPMTVNELKGFFGLCIFMGLRNLPEMRMYWSYEHYDGSSIFIRTMTCKRFQQIASHVRMGSWVTEWRASSCSKDQLRIFRPMLNILELSMWETYKPNRNLTIDRALLPRLDIEAAKEKRQEAQPRVWLLCDSKSGYCHRLYIQTRCKTGRGMGHSVVPALVEGIEGKHHHIYLSKSLSSIPVMQELLVQENYSSASVLPESPILPRALWDQGPVETPGDFRQYTCGPVLVTRWRDAKEMFCMSTNCQPGLPDDVWRKSNTKAGELISIKRPLAFKLLQDNMRGVDICNQLLTCNPLGGMVFDTHWRCLFWLLVNLSIINSFIVLRESRKHNPPVWVQDGRFSQAQYRKRLAFQLAKCAYREPEPFVRTVRKHRRKRVKLLGFRPKEERESDEEQGVRHYLCKITPKTRRCRNCMLKNARHESVFGCSSCKINLCKSHICFWEYHGFSSQLKVSPYVGFTESHQGSDMRRNRLADSVFEPLEDESMLERDPDEAMAPLEYSESDMEQMDDQMQTSAEEFKEISRNSGQVVSEKTDSLVAPTHGSPILEPQCSARKQENTSLNRQLKTVLCALCSGINKASEILATEPKLIEVWLREKEMQLECECQGVGIDGGEAGGPVEWLVEWVLAQREQQLPVSEQNLFQKASEFHSLANQNSTFKISYEWAVRFMLQHNLGAQAIANVGRSLPRSLECSSQHFTDSVHQQIKLNGLHHSVIGAMDELSIFVDVDCLLDTDTLDKKPAFQFVGSGRSLIDIHLSILADGTVLPTLLFFNGQLPSRLHSGLPNCVLVEGKDEGFTEDEELNIWIERVWRKHLSAHSESESKALLVTDDHCGHKSLTSQGLLNNCNTLPATIPTGCSSRHQPLEVCFRPVLQTFLLTRWDRLAEKGGATGASAGGVAELLVAWLVEALTSVSEQPEFIQRSFRLAKVIDSGDEGDKNPADAQAEMMAALKKAMPPLEEMEPELSKDEIPEDTMVTETKRKQDGDVGQESHLEGLPGPQAETLSNTKEQVAVIQTDNKTE